MIPSSRSCRRARILCTCPLPMSMSMHEHRTQENTGHYSDHEHGEVQRRVRAPKTLVENRRLAEAITEELGSKDVQKVKGSDLDVFYDRLSRRGLSASSVRRYHAVCSAALNQAVKWGLLERSPAAQASPPTMERHEPDAPTPEGMKLLIERAEEKDPELATLLVVAATTGCRRGELRGLRWSNVDFEKGVIPKLLPREAQEDVFSRRVPRALPDGGSSGNRARHLSLVVGTSQVSWESVDGRGALGAVQVAMEAQRGCLVRRIDFDFGWYRPAEVA